MHTRKGERDGDSSDRPGREASHKALAQNQQRYLKMDLGDFPGGPVVKNPPSNAGDTGFDPWSGN